MRFTRTPHLSTAATIGCLAALALSACGSSTTSTTADPAASIESTTRAASDVVGTADPASSSSATDATSTLPPSSSDDASAAVDQSERPADEPDGVVDPDDRDETPEAGEEPQGLVPIEDIPLADPDDVRVDVAPRRIELPQPPPPVATPADEMVELTLFPQLPDPELGSGGLDFAAATGCADHCIDGATITPVGGSSSRHDLRVDVESPATIEAYLSLTPIERNDDGRYIAPSSTPTATDTVGFGWTHSFDLDPSTEYHLLVRAIDEQGRSEVAGSFTTAASMGPSELAVPQPCADGCLEWVDTITSDDGTEVGFSVRADVDVALEVAWSPDPFVQGADGPTLEDPFVSTTELPAGHVHTLRLSERPPNTAHSFMVTATDSAGGVDRMVASIATPSPVILAGIDRVHVRGDGDDGRLDRGEIKFKWGDVRAGGTGDRWGYRAEEKMPSNTSLRLGRDAGSVISADGSGHYPAIALYAGERDGSQLMACFVGIDEPADWRPEGTVTWCGRERTTWSHTYVPQLTLAEIEQLSTCEPFDVENPDADRCAWVQTSPNSSDQVSFDMIVWFDID